MSASTWWPASGWRTLNAPLPASTLRDHALVGVEPPRHAVDLAVGHHRAAGGVVEDVVARHGVVELVRPRCSSRTSGPRSPIRQRGAARSPSTFGPRAAASCRRRLVHDAEADAAAPRRPSRRRNVPSARTGAHLPRSACRRGTRCSRPARRRRRGHRARSTRRSACSARRRPCPRSCSLPASIASSAGRGRRRRRRGRRRRGAGRVLRGGGGRTPARADDASAARARHAGASLRARRVERPARSGTTTTPPDHRQHPHRAPFLRRRRARARCSARADRCTAAAIRANVEQAEDRRRSMSSTMNSISGRPRWMAPKTTPVEHPAGDMPSARRAPVKQKPRKNSSSAIGAITQTRTDVARSAPASSRRARAPGQVVLLGDARPTDRHDEDDAKNAAQASSAQPTAGQSACRRRPNCRGVAGGSSQPRPASTAPPISAGPARTCRRSSRPARPRRRPRRRRPARRSGRYAMPATATTSVASIAGEQRPQRPARQPVAARGGGGGSGRPTPSGSSGRDGRPGGPAEGGGTLSCGSQA